MASPTQAYVAYLEEVGTGVIAGVDTVNAKVVRLDRTQTPVLNGAGFYTPWEVTALSFDEGPFEFDATMAGAEGRSWLDPDPLGFDLENDAVSVTLYLVNKQRVPGPKGTTDRLVLWQCSDAVGTFGTAGVYVNCQANVGEESLWTGFLFDDASSSGSAQPTLAATSGGVAVTWLARGAVGAPNDASDSDALSLDGSYSIDQGMTFSAIQTLSAPSTPCPTPPTPANPFAAGVFSERMSSVVILEPFAQVDPSSTLPPTAPTIVSVYTSSSGGCLSIGEATEDQHVEAVTW
jgi:hypothetical protein